MVVVAHAMSFARRVATTVHVMHEGTVAESGPPAQVFEAPATEVTRAFLTRGERARAKAPRRSHFNSKNDAAKMPSGRAAFRLVSADVVPQDGLRATEVAIRVQSFPK